MPTSVTEIVRCPVELRAQAVALVLDDLSPSLRREVAGALLDNEVSADVTGESLFVALREGEIRGAAWGQIQSGKIAVFWPPRLVADENPQTAGALAEAVVGALDATAIEMMQVLLPTPDPDEIDLLRRVGFRHLADLLYLTWESARFPDEGRALELEFEAYEPSQRSRLMALIERTYEGTLDCTALDGVRDINDVINGYENTGDFRPENWMIVRGDGRDVGVLLLAEHPSAGHLELMYMGLVPEARGRGWGGQITEHAQQVVRRAGIERIVAAVDATNTPAVRVYLKAGFDAWDRRTVYARISPRAQT